MPRLASFLLFLSVTCLHLAHAQPHPDDLGAWGKEGGYAIPPLIGGSPEFSYCVAYAKRAWRVGNLVGEGRTTVVRAQSLASEQLGKNAAAMEIADYEKLQSGAFKSAHEMGAARLLRCGEALKLPRQMLRRAHAEQCFRFVSPLDVVARARAEGATREQAANKLRDAKMGLQDSTIKAVVAAGYKGKTIAEGSAVIEEVFSECYARTGGGK